MPGECLEPPCRGFPLLANSVEGTTCICNGKLLLGRSYFDIFSTSARCSSHSPARSAWINLFKILTVSMFISHSFVVGDVQALLYTVMWSCTSWSWLVASLHKEDTPAASVLERSSRSSWRFEANTYIVHVFLFLNQPLSKCLPV